MLRKTRTHGQMPQENYESLTFHRRKITACRENEDPIRRGDSLAEIRDRNLYRFEFPNFDHFCREACGLSRAQANRLIKAAGIWGERAKFARLPKTVTLLCLLACCQPDRRETIWEEVLRRCGQPGTRPTTAMLRRVLRETDGKPAPKRRIRTASSPTMKRIEEFFWSPGDSAPTALSPEEMRQAVLSGLEILGTFLIEDEEAAQTVIKLQVLVKSLWPSVTPP